MNSIDDKCLKSMQKVQLNLLKELDRVCKNNNLKYCLSSGTCLGALRHGGFIPWDDDIDVYMSWKDAKKLLKCQDQFDEKYFVQCYDSDPNFGASIYRLCDSSTSCFLKGRDRVDINHGIFIDIYIYYPCYKNITIIKTIFKSQLHRLLLSHNTLHNGGLLLRYLGGFFNIIYTGERRHKKIKELESYLCKDFTSKYVATYFGRDIGLNKLIYYPLEWFENPRYLQFEDMVVPCPKETEKYCELQYGKNFMQLPPEEARVPHHDFLYFSTEEPYTKFKGIYY